MDAPVKASMSQNSIGFLTVAAVDIGNYADIPRRTIGSLHDSEIIVCESIHVLKLIALNNKLNIKEKSIIEFNENISRPDRVLDNLMSQCKLGKRITLISNQGTPLIKDPGQEIIKKFREEGLTIKCIPGPSSIIAALSISGMPTDSFYFYGWIPALYKDRSEVLNSIKNNLRCTVVMFEPIFSNAYQSILDVNDIFGDNKKMSILIDISRESEQVFYGTTKDAISWIDQIVNSELLSQTNPDIRYITYVIDNNTTISQ